MKIFIIIIILIICVYTQEFSTTGKKVKKGDVITEKGYFFTEKEFNKLITDHKISLNIQKNKILFYKNFHEIFYKNKKVDKKLKFFEGIGFSLIGAGTMFFFDNVILNNNSRRKI